MARISKSYRFDPLTLAMLRRLMETGDYSSETSLIEQCIHNYYICCTEDADPLLSAYMAVVQEIADGGLGANGPQIGSD